MLSRYKYVAFLINRQCGGVETENFSCLLNFKGGRGADGFQRVGKIQVLPFGCAHFVIREQFHAFNALVL